jgi:aspartate/methionine/tyrosine aminotransferase
MNHCNKQCTASPISDTFLFVCCFLNLQVYDRDAAVSPLALPGALARCVELFSFAKSYQLGGFRLGFALGNEQAIAALEAVKVRPLNLCFA